MIVLEGPDNSGKSTLALYLAPRLGKLIVESEGPPKYDGEIAHRLERYQLKVDRPNPPIFVRHPIVSQPIYATIRDDDDDGIPPQAKLEFYNSRPLFIYCDPGDRGLEGHVEKEGESKKHLKAVREQHEELVRLYRRWAIDHATIIYRIGDDFERVFSAVRLTR